MVIAPPTHDEAGRLAALADYDVLDTAPEAAFDDLTALAARICGVPICLVSLVDAGRQWFKSATGPVAVRQTPRDVAFCAHTILGRDLMVVPDAAADERFRDNPLVVGEPHARFYAGMPLVGQGGHAVGSLCVVDHVPRGLSDEQADALRVLGRQVVSLLEHRRAARALHASECRFRVAAGCATDLIYDWDVVHGRLEWFGDIDAAMGFPPGGFPRTLAAWEEHIHPEDKSAVITALDESVRLGRRFSQQYRVIRMDGSVRYWDDRGSPLSGLEEAGSAIPATGGAATADVPPTRRLIGTVTDVTERRLAEDALRETDARLRRQNAALVDLARQRAVGGPNLRVAAAAVTAVAARTLDVARSSVWLYDERRTRITSLNLYERESDRHTDGHVLAAADYPAYFAAVDEDRTIAARDARTDPRTAEFRVGYLTPLGITSMLDAPIRVGGRTVGVLCQEHVGPPRQWTVDEVAFVDSLTSAMAIAFEAAERHRAEADRLRAEAARSDSEERFRAFMDHSPTVKFIKDEQGRLVYGNRRLRERFGLAADGGAGRSVADLWPPDVAQRLRAMDAAVLRDGTVAEAHEAVRRPDGQDEHWLFLTFPLDGVGTDRAGKMLGGIALDMTQQRRAELAMAHAARHDALTGLPNRQLFRERVGLCLERTRRDPDYRFAVMFADLDGFKLVNDSLGHAVGDCVLVEVGRRLEACVRPGTGAASSATVARMGGDEFLVLLDGVADPADVDRAAERVVRALSQPLPVGGQEVVTPASVGIAHGNAGYQVAEDLLRDADAAMYRAKALGKGRCVTFNPALHEAALKRLRLEADLRRALERGELLLHYQPIVSLRTRQTVGFEALIRWRREDRLVSPLDFIPAAEETGLIVPIGAWVLAEACRQLAAWRAGSPEAADLTVSVNVSRRQLATPGLIGDVRGALAATGVPPGLLKLEITESIIMDDSADARAVLDEIRAMGVKLQMDDFGTGYSSLSCLNKLPLDGLKIDRAFIRDVSVRRDAVAILQAITSLAHNLHVEVVAEGLETPEQVALLQSLECDYGQGYYFAKPLPAEAATAFLAADVPVRTLDALSA